MITGGIDAIGPPYRAGRYHRLSAGVACGGACVTRRREAGRAGRKWQRGRDRERPGVREARRCRRSAGSRAGPQLLRGKRPHGGAVCVCRGAEAPGGPRRANRPVLGGVTAARPRKVSLSACQTAPGLGCERAVPQHLSSGKQVGGGLSCHDRR